jgi:hypothetical protein
VPRPISVAGADGGPGTVAADWPWRSLVAHRVWDAGVVGSNPSGQTKKSCRQNPAGRSTAPRRSTSLPSVGEDEIAELARRVRECSEAPTSERCRALVEEALGSKWEGVQSVALQVLGTWGDAQSRALLRSAIEQLDARQYGWSIRGVAVRALSACVTSDDADWALDRLFALEGELAKHEFLPVVRALPVDSVQTRLLVEASSSNRDDRQAAMKAIGNMDIPGRDEVLSRFREDEDEHIRLGARLLLDRG